MRFTLDGQLATVDDYLEIRPEAEERIRALVASGRLALGPWQTLMDEFLVDGETTLRNLEAGLARASEQFGSAMRVGYLPDMFGHVAQMPQILRARRNRDGGRLAGRSRGDRLPPVRLGRRWTAPRSSPSTCRPATATRRTSSTSRAPVDLEPLRGALPAVVPRRRPARHGRHRPHAARARLHGAHSGRRRSWGRSRSTSPTRRRKGWRTGAASCAPVRARTCCPGVVSARIDLKAACARAERWLERYAEPLQALYGGDWPEPFLAQAWTRMFQNSAHDSICGCSADEVSAQVLVRYAEAEQIGRELARRAVARIADEVPRGALRGREPVASRTLRSRRARCRRSRRLGGGRARASRRLPRPDPGDRPPGTAAVGDEARRRRRPARDRDAVSTGASSSAAS